MNDYCLGLWNDHGGAHCEGHRFIRDNEDLPEAPEGLCVVSPQADAARIDALLAAGAEQVLLGESALQDPALLSEAVTRHGGERIGVWLPVRRAAVSWGFDTTSNADFSTVAVTNPVPRWVVVLENGSVTDVDAQWWSGQMMAAGCSTVLVSVARPEDDDLLACAEMAESAGARFWLDTGSADVEELRFWIRYGQARQLVLPSDCDVNAANHNLARRLAEDETQTCSA